MGLAATKQEAFWEACGFGHKEKVRRFIAEGIDINWVSYTHNSCAIHVASQGKKEIVQMLLDAGCKVNARDDRGNLALHHAAMKGHADIIQMLIDAKSEIDAQDKNGWTSLINAAYFCEPDAVQVLVDNKCSVHLQNKDSRTALHEACRSQSTDEDGLYRISRLLIDAGSDINSKSSDVGEADFTPLMFCGYHGHPKVAQALIDAGCDIHAQGSNQWTALHWAADRSQPDVIRTLLQAGLDPLIPGRRGELAKDRAQNNEIRELLDQAVREAVAKEEEQDASNPKSCSQTSEAQLKRINISIQTTAEDHEILVQQRSDRGLMSVSTTSSLSSLEDDLANAAIEAAQKGDGSCASSVVEEGDGDDKDRDHYDPESALKGGAMLSDNKDLDCIANGDNQEVTLNGMPCGEGSSPYVDVAVKPTI